MRRLVRRLRRTTSAELRFRCASLAHICRERISVAAGREAWDRTRLRAKLTPGPPRLDAARHALAAGRWAEAETALRTHFLERPQRFVIAPSRRVSLASAIRERFPDAQRDAAARAAGILEGRYDLLGYHALSFATSSAAVDWHLDPVHGCRAPLDFWSRVPFLDPHSGDHKIIWELNRHQHWLALGRAAWLTDDARYASRFASELDSWMRANPPLVGINWASMLELAFRTISWMWALHLFAHTDVEPNAAPFVDLLLALDRQLDHVERHLSTYFSPNTHLLGEGLALYVGGRSLPELQSSARREAAGRRILVREARAQVHADGGHAELSTHYHRYALDFYLLALIVARRTNDPVEPVLAEVTSRLATFCRALADDRGRLPTIGDDDGGMLFPICGRAPVDAADSLAVAAAVLDRPDLAVGDPPEEALWMLGDDHRHSGAARVQGGVSPEAARLFPDTGYAVIRGDGEHAIVDVGHHGFMNGGHAHADALSMLLSIGGRPFLIDPGTSTYTMDRERRDRFRATAMHNTLVIDGRAQSLPDGPFHWAATASAHVDFWRTGLGCACIDASHDGYLPIVHRRTVLRTPDGLWLVADHVLGTGEHAADAYWHISPDWELLPAEAGRTRAVLVHADGTVAAIASTAGRQQEFCGDDEGLGWCAPVYGQLLPAPTLRFSSAGRAPFSMITAVASGPAAACLAACEVAVTPSEECGWHAAGARISLAGGIVLSLFTASLPSRSSTRRCAHSLATGEGQFSTDARAAVLHLSAAGRPRGLLAIDCSFAEWSGEDAFRLIPDAGEQDLHLGVDALDRLSHVSAVRPAG